MISNFDSEKIRTLIYCMMVLLGVTHNIPLLRDILTEERFIKGDINTKYLPEV